jgi:hypothetical protein
MAKVREINLVELNDGDEVNLDGMKSLNSVATPVVPARKKITGKLAGLMTTVKQALTPARKSTPLPVAPVATPQDKAAVRAFFDAKLVPQDPRIVR